MDLRSKKMKNAMFLITFAITLMWFFDNLSSAGRILGKALAIISPFIIGAGMAFVLNSPMMFIEKTLFGKKSALKRSKDNLKRFISYFITLVLFIASILVILLIIIPELASTIQDLAEKLPLYLDNIRIYILENLENNPQITQWLKGINIDWASMEQNVISFTKNSILNWIGTTFTFASSVVGGLVTFVLAFIFSIYVLLQKEELTRQIKKVILAFASEKVANKIFYIGRLSNNVFGSFLSGQLLEAVIIGLLFLLAMTIFNFPYAIMISLLIGVTALIPMVGAFIGCGVGTFLILVDNPTKAFWFVIMFLVIQQIEGNLIYPHVVGKASGLPSIWILVAVTVGGGLMGVIGIFLFIPISSILYTIIRETVNYRLRQKNIEVE